MRKEGGGGERESEREPEGFMLAKPRPSHLMMRRLYFFFLKWGSGYKKKSLESLRRNGRNFEQMYQCEVKRWTLDGRQTRRNEHTLTCALRKRLGKNFMAFVRSTLMF